MIQKVSRAWSLTGLHPEGSHWAHLLPVMSNLIKSSITSALEPCSVKHRVSLKCLSRFLFCCAEMALEKLWVVRWLYQAPNGHCFCIMGIAMTQRSLEWAIQKFPLDFCMCLQICYTFIYHTYTRECARHINTFSLYQALLRRSPRQLDQAMQEFMGCQKWCLHQSCMSQHR